MTERDRLELDRVVLTGSWFTCTKCGIPQPGSQVGLRVMADGTIRNQPQCSRCRSQADTSPRSVLVQVTPADTFWRVCITAGRISHVAEGPPEHVLDVLGLLVREAAQGVGPFAGAWSLPVTH